MNLWEIIDTFKFSLGCIAYTIILFTVDFTLFGEATLVPGLLLLIMAFSNEVQLMDANMRYERYKREYETG